jgi:uncharacterized membrane protein YccF (DUF307 family)
MRYHQNPLFTPQEAPVCITEMPFLPYREAVSARQTASKNVAKQAKNVTMNVFFKLLQHIFRVFAGVFLLLQPGNVAGRIATFRTTRT